MKRKMIAFTLALLAMAICLEGCGRVSGTTSPSTPASSNLAASETSPSKETPSPAGEPAPSPEEAASTEDSPIRPDSGILQLEDGFSAVEYEGDYGFDDFLAQGGAASDGEVVGFLAEKFLSGSGLGFLGQVFGCSTIAVATPEGNALFGRNFDWNRCDAMVVLARPENGYASISTVNMDFITHSASGPVGMALNLDQVRTLAALYAPLDGMNEKGLGVSVNMIQDSASIDQNTGKPGLTTTTAIRLLLDKAANVEEALELLRQYDLHGSMGMMVHFAIADSSGRSVAVEYIDSEMVVIETPVLTNYYLAPGEKNGIGTAQSHERFAILTGLMAEHPAMTPEEVRDALSRVSKGNFGEFESTEWSAVFQLDAGIARYYHRENYDTCYTFSIQKED